MDRVRLTGVLGLGVRQFDMHWEGTLRRWSVFNAVRMKLRYIFPLVI